MASIRPRRRQDGSKSYQVRGRGIPTETFESLRDARLYKADMERRAMLGELYQAAPESFGAILDAFLDRKAALGWRPSTTTSNREVARYLVPLRETPLPQLRRADAEDAIAAAAARAPRRAQKARELLFATLSDARSRGHRVDDAIFGIPRPRYEEREARFLTIEQLDELESWMPEYVRRIIPAAGLLGMRQGELFALVDADLQLDEGYLDVRRGKTKAARRRVRLGGEIVTVFREQLLARPGGTQLVFPTPTGLVWDRNRFMERVFRPARIAAGVDGVTFHDLRHTAISLMAVAGWRPEHIAEQVGHADGGALIFRRYRHLFAGEMEREAARLDDMLRGRRLRSANG